MVVELRVAALLLFCCSQACVVQTSGASTARLRSDVEVGGSHETLTGNRADWTSVYVEGVHRPAERQALYGGIRQTRRFSLEDTEASAGVYYPLGETWEGVFEASVSPTHRVLPKYAAYAQLQKLIGAGWNVGAAVRHTEYTASGTNLLALSVERYWGNFRAAYTLYLGRPEGASSASAHGMQIAYYYAERSSVALAHTTGKEVENVGTGGAPQLLTTDVRNWTISGRHWIAAHWAVTYELLTHEQGSLYRRKGGRLGLRYSF